MKNNQLAPIVIFVYNRPKHTKQTLESLAKNLLANKSYLYIIADGSKQKNDNKVTEVRNYIKTIEALIDVQIPIIQDHPYPLDPKAKPPVHKKKGSRYKKGRKSAASKKKKKRWY